MELYVSQCLLFLMLFARSTAMIVVAPVLGHQSIPVQVKVAIGAFLAFVMYPIAAGNAPVLNAELLSLVVMALKEIAVGVVIGFATALIFAGVRFAGDLASMDTGLSIASMFDAEHNQQTSVLTELMYLFLLMVFILVNGHHFVLEALQMSYVAVPIGGVAFDHAVSASLIHITSVIFIIAVKLAAPIIISMFVVNVALSILSRVMPQMNIFAIAFPAKLLAGFAVIMVSAPLLVFVFKELLVGFETNIFELMRLL